MQNEERERGKKEKRKGKNKGRTWEHKKEHKFTKTGSNLLNSMNLCSFVWDAFHWMFAILFECFIWIFWQMFYFACYILVDFVAVSFHCQITFIFLCAYFLLICLSQVVHSTRMDVKSVDNTVWKKSSESLIFDLLLLLLNDLKHCSVGIGVSLYRL